MKILLLNVNIGKEWAYGGMESHSEILASVLAQRGHTVVMGCWIDGIVTAQTAGASFRAIRIRTANSGDLIALSKIVIVCLKERFDIIIANHGKDFWPAAIASALTGVPIVFIRHMGSRLKKTTAWLINRKVEKVIAVSGAVRDTLVASGVSEKKIEVIYNSILLDRFNPERVDREEAKKELGIGGEDIVVGTVGKLNAGKGVFDLLAAFQRLSKDYPCLKLLFVGDGDDRQGLEREAEKASVLDRIVFAGARRDVERMYAAMDIFVLPSTCEEAFGMVIIEAMAMAKPVVATRIGGIPEIVEDGINGMLVPPGNPEAIAHAISRYLTDNSFKTEMAGSGRRMTEQRFSDIIMGERFETVLMGLIREKSR